MELAGFLEGLRESGEVRLSGSDPLGPDALQAARPLLASLEERAALDLPGEAPGLDLDVACWAAELVFHACQAFVFRELPPEEVGRRLARPCPGPLSPASAWSADLCLRHLPALQGLAQALGDEDPLNQRLAALGREWPLSSVGMPGLGALPAARLEPVLTHPALRRCYVDRVLLRRDRGRLDDPRVCEGARAALGLYPELCPELAGVLAGEES